MNEELTYPLLSKYSILRMLHHPLSMFGSMTRQRLQFFLSFDAGYNFPSIIQRVVERAEKMGLLKSYQGIVSFTDEAIELIKEYEIKDGVNEKFWKARDLEREGKSRLAREVYNTDKDSFWWMPEEWMNVKVIKREEPSREKTQPGITVTRKMPLPRKLRGAKK